MTHSSNSRGKHCSCAQTHRENILHDELGWVPGLLPPDQKLTRLTLSKQIWLCLKQTKPVFSLRMSVGFTSLSQRPKVEAPWLTSSKEGKSRLLRRKVMASLFLDAKDIVFIDSLKKGRTMASQVHNKFTNIGM